MSSCLVPLGIGTLHIQGPRHRPPRHHHATTTPPLFCEASSLKAAVKGGKALTPTLLDSDLCHFYVILPRDINRYISYKHALNGRDPKQDSKGFAVLNTFGFRNNQRIFVISF